MKKSAAQVIQDHPELCSVANVGTLAVKLARHSFFGDEVLRASSLTGKNGPPPKRNTTGASSELYSHYSRPFDVIGGF